MNLGRYQLGQFVTATCFCKDASGDPSVPADPPYMEVWAGATLVLAKEIPVVDRYTVDGLFRYKLPLDGQFSAGSYIILYHYTVSSFVAVDQDEFEVVAGGNADGCVTAMTYFEKPHGGFIVYKTDHRKLFFGRNPTV